MIVHSFIHSFNNINYNKNFKGQLKLNAHQMDIIDLNLFKYHSGDICEFVQKQKYDYTIERAFNKIHVYLEEKGQQIAECLVMDYIDGNGHKHKDKVFDAIKTITNRYNNRSSDCIAVKI